MPLGCSDDGEATTIESPKSDAKSIIEFSFDSAVNAQLENNVPGVISEIEKTITVELPQGVDISTLVPTITISELASINPSGEQDFTMPITYEVTAEDGSTMDYVVNVSLDGISLNGMNPLGGPKNTVVTFTGTNFGIDIDKVNVFFDNIKAEVQQVNQTSIVAVVPPKAFSGVVKILVEGKELDGFVFDYQISEAQVSILAGALKGFVDGDVSEAQFSSPYGITIDNDGNLYVTDNNSVRKITFEFEGDLLANILVSTLAGNGNFGSANGMGPNARFDAPTGITAASNGNLYVADTFNNSIRTITPSGEVSTLIGEDSPSYEEVFGTDSPFGPIGITLNNENNLYITDQSNHSIKKIILPDEISTLAGEGISGFVDATGTNARFSFPKDIAIDSEGNFYVTDSENNSIRKITPSGIVTTLAGGSTSGFENGLGSEAKFNFPQGITIDKNDNLYVVDVGNHSIRKITPSGIVSTLAGNGTPGFSSGVGSEALFNKPRGITIDADGNLYVVDGGNHSIRLLILE